jgi:hypothetical protein
VLRIVREGVVERKIGYEEWGKGKCEYVKESGLCDGFGGYIGSFMYQPWTYNMHIYMPMYVLCNMPC